MARTSLAVGVLLLCVAVLAVTPLAQSAKTPSVVNAATPLHARHSPFLDGNRSPPLAAGRPGRVDVIALGPYDNSLPIVVRNNTERTVSRIVVAGEALAPSGAQLGTGYDQIVRPNLVKPGEIAIGLVYFKGFNLPSSTRFRLHPTWQPAHMWFENRRDLVIGKAAGHPGRIVGDARNSYPTSVNLVEAFVACFSSFGRLLSTASDFLDRDKVGRMRRCRSRWSWTTAVPCT